MEEVEGGTHTHTHSSSSSGGGASAAWRVQGLQGREKNQAGQPTAYFGVQKAD